MRRSTSEKGWWCDKCKEFEPDEDLARQGRVPDAENCPRKAEHNPYESCYTCGWIRWKKSDNVLRNQRQTPPAILGAIPSLRMMEPDSLLVQAQITQDVKIECASSIHMDDTTLSLVSSHTHSLVYRHTDIHIQTQIQTHAFSFIHTKKDTKIH